MKHRDVGSLVLAGYNGGIKRGVKGYATWEQQELSAYAKSRKRDERGRFIREDDREEAESEVRAQ